ncbi:MAG: LTA synthase family protein [Brumimicrobium sp.]|nr:LTA synthase family protein [Brumimicrobium sp.]
MGGLQLKTLWKKDFSLLKQLGVILLVMTITRIVFFIANRNSFENVVLFDFLAGIWIDAITIGIYFLPYYCISLLPFPLINFRWFQLFLKVLFMVTSIVILVFNLIDVEYYKYTSKRSTSDLFTMITTGNDVNQLITTFIIDFWWLIILLILFIILINYLFNKTLPKEKLNYYPILELLNCGLGVAIFIIIGRGGIGIRPADMLTASQFTTPQKIALVTNTPLSIIKTMGKHSLEEKNYFPENSPIIYQPIHKGSQEHQINPQANVMVIILESFGNEWLGKKNGKNYTPFLDSLLDQSLYFTNAFANGKKSIESLPSIFAGIPSLFDNPYISSKYETNEINSLVSILKDQGYSSAFYHGATNGSMKFDVFTSHLGFDHYFGRNEYDNEAHSDGTWGILDEYFLPWTVRSITKELREPFIASVFTLSSHHPFYVPEKYRNILPKGKHPMAQAVAYTDMSLRLFFEEAKKQPWYDNTIFVLVADHTPTGVTSRFAQQIGMFEIPIAFFDPSGKLEPKQEEKIFNQIDIMPTVLDLLGYNKDVYSFGNSYYSDKKSFSINYIENTFLYFQDNYMINFIGDKINALYNYKIDTMMYYDSLSQYANIGKEMETNLKGFIQRYNRDLINNSMTLK